MTSARFPILAPEDFRRSFSFIAWTIGIAANLLALCGLAKSITAYAGPDCAIPWVKLVLGLA